MIDLYRYPRLYLNGLLKENLKIFLSVQNSHYLKNVLRKSKGDILRVFNGKDGEWLAVIDVLEKRSCKIIIDKKIKEQVSSSLPISLFFSPIKKNRMDFLIEKSVELGVTDLYPVIMNRTENRKINEERINLQIIEAVEQSERLDLPNLHSARKLADILSCNNIFHVCLERNITERRQHISSYSYNQGGAFIIGPEGGFDDMEVELLLSKDNVNVIGLGDNILRAETAAIACLSYVVLSNRQID